MAGAGLIAESGVACGAHGILAGCWYNCIFRGDFKQKCLESSLCKDS